MQDVKPASVWTDENTALLKKLWAEGLSSSQIAGRIGGMSRNAVIGKVHRLDLAGRKEVRITRKGKPRTKSFDELDRPSGSTSGIAELEFALFGRTFGTRGRPKAEAYTPPADIPTVIATVSFLDAESKHCRNIPLDLDPKHVESHEPLFCGDDRVPGLPYCKSCCQRNYTPPLPRKSTTPSRVHVPESQRSRVHCRARGLATV